LGDRAEKGSWTNRRKVTRNVLEIGDVSRPVSRKGWAGKDGTDHHPRRMNRSKSGKRVNFLTFHGPLCRREEQREAYKKGREEIERKASTLRRAQVVMVGGSEPKKRDGSGPE